MEREGEKEEGTRKEFMYNRPIPSSDMNIINAFGEVVLILVISAPHTPIHNTRLQKSYKRKEAPTR